MRSPPLYAGKRRGAAARAAPLRISSARPRGDLAQPGGYGLLVTPSLPPLRGARLGGRDGVRLGCPCEAPGRGRGRPARARLLTRLGGNRHCRQTYRSSGGLSTPFRRTVSPLTGLVVQDFHEASMATGMRTYSR